MKYCRPILVALLAALLAGCIIDTVPLPELGGKDKIPTDPSLDNGTGTREPQGINTSALYWASSPTILVGSERSMPASAKVVVLNPKRPQWEGNTQAEPNGSFNLPLNASTGDEIDVSAWEGEVVIDEATVVLEPASVAATKAGMDMDAALATDYGEVGPDPTTQVVVDWPDPNTGIVMVSGPGGIVAPGITVVVANLDGGAATAVAAELDGSFKAGLAGVSGDELSIVAVELASSNGGAEPIQAFVP